MHKRQDLSVSVRLQKELTNKKKSNKESLDEIYKKLWMYMATKIKKETSNHRCNILET